MSRPASIGIWFLFCHVSMYTTETRVLIVRKYCKRNRQGNNQFSLSFHSSHAILCITYQICNICHLDGIVNHLCARAPVPLLEHCFVYDYCRFDVLCGLAYVPSKPELGGGCVRPRLAPDALEHTGHGVHLCFALRPALRPPLHAARIGTSLVGLRSRLEDDVRVLLLRPQ